MSWSFWLLQLFLLPRASDPDLSNAQWENLANLGPALASTSRDPEARMEYSETIAKGAIVYSGISYKANDDRKTDLTKCLAGAQGHSTNFTVTKTVQTKMKDHTVAAMAGYHSDDYIVIAFEGTDSDWQLINEWSALSDVGFDGNTTLRVVSYWNTVALDQVENLTTALLDLIDKHPKAPILFTGHSLGAATMTLALAYMQFRQHILLPHDRLFIYTFGQPRVGGLHFSRWYDEFFPQHQRVVHYDDVVPHVPCCILKGMGSQCDEKSTSSFVPWHVSTEVWYTSSDMAHYKICDGAPVGEDPNCAFSIHPWSYSITDHLTYFGAHVGYMCEILEYAWPTGTALVGVEEEDRRRAWTEKLNRRRQGLICFW